MRTCIDCDKICPLQIYISSIKISDDAENFLFSGIADRCKDYTIDNDNIRRF